jgi:uncharacterized protein with ParB-like and HNH nuclease domain/predicted transport protein
MKAEETKFLKFLNSPKQLIIPLYQRTYSWNLNECEQLWKDIIKAGSDDEISGHFVGSIVYVEKGLYQVSSLPKLLVIDGQQRLTTLSLIISAICDHIKEKNLQTEFNLAEKLTNYYLLNTQEEGEERYKLILTQSDKDSYIKILEKINLEDEDSNRIKKNYDFFREQIAKTDLNIIHNGILKLIIIDVSLDREKDNPQLIFESLNSTGLELTQADLIRNYILMGLEKEKQEDLYKNYWYPMEKNFGHSENSGLFDRFMRDYLTIKLGRIPTVKEIYSEFKQYSLNKDIKEIVKDIFEFSKYFANIALEKEPDKEIREIFLDINELKVDVSYPFILQIYSDYIKEKITKEDLIQILKLIESYVFRRAICGVPTNSLNKTFSTLYKSIDKENYLESVQAIIILQDSYRRCPNDDEFKRELIIKDVYNFRNRNYLLRRLENFERKEYVDVESYTIEHIMPQNQNLSDEWKKELGENWKEIQKTYLHTIGNLTLTGYNSELSDRPFKVKRDMEGGFKDSPIRLNNFLANKENWNEEKIKERAEEVTKLAIKTWSYPKLNSETLSKYAPKEEETEKQKYTIDDHKYLKEGELMRPLFEELRKKILNIDSSVKEDSKFLYIAYKSVTNFVDIIPQQKALRLSLNISFDKIKDPKGLCKDVAGKGKWGNGDTEIKISTNKEIDYALNLIKQAFDNIAGIE